MNELTTEQAIELGKTKFWEKLSAREIAEFQLFTDKLCMPFDIFHKALEDSLGRPVWTHELGSGNFENIRKEFLGEKSRPTMNEIIELIPQEKRIVIGV